MTKTNEPFWWALFSAGGTIAAFLIPVLVLVTGLAGPLGWEFVADGFAYHNVRALLSEPLAKLFVLAAVPLPLFHCAHRVRHTVEEFGVHAPGAMALLCYGGAAVGSVLCGLVVAQL